MKTLQQCKDEVSHKHGHETWNSLMDPIIADKVMTAYTLYHNAAYELYASQFKREWIPVTERLPEYDSKNDGKYSKDVLVYTASLGNIYTAYFDNENKRWLSCVFDNYLHNVTHWMPLPEKPIP